MTNKQKKMLGRVLFSLAAFSIASLIKAEGWVRLLLYLIPYLVIGWDILYRSVRNILRGQVFDEHFLMTVATLGAFALGEYPEATFVMLFYQVGELFQSFAVSRSRRSITALMDLMPDWANVEREGELVQVDPAELAPGDLIIVKPGEKIPLDGRVVKGTSHLDTAALTGESRPCSVHPGDEVLSGSVNQQGLITVEVTRPLESSTVSKILEMVENAASRKAPAERFITRFARYYTPAVTLMAVLLAVLPSLWDGQWEVWCRRALIFLVISCPCALVISVPMSYFGGIGGASRRGILIKGANYLEALAKVKTVVFDKTGTLTQGSFQVCELHPQGVTQQELLEAAAAAESRSDHPIALSLRKAWGRETKGLTDVRELPGFGVIAEAQGRRICVGSGRLLEHEGIPFSPVSKEGTVVHVGIDGVYDGWIRISDAIKEDAARTVQGLRQLGIRRCVMLTGDDRQAGEAVSRQLKMDQCFAGLLPHEKVSRVEELMGEGKGLLAFVGDGVNDAPVLTRADVGVAMGGIGSDAAIEAADIVLMDDQPSKMVTAVSIARKTQRIVIQNIVFALGVKAAVLILGACGLATMWAATFADVGVSVLAILNAMRAMKAE